VYSTAATGGSRAPASAALVVLGLQLITACISSCFLVPQLAAAAATSAAGSAAAVGMGACKQGAAGSGGGLQRHGAGQVEGLCE
jgi:hypothetical protein